MKHSLSFCEVLGGKFGRIREKTLQGLEELFVPIPAGCERWGLLKVSVIFKREKLLLLKSPPELIIS